MISFGKGAVRYPHVLHGQSSYNVTSRAPLPAPIGYWPMSAYTHDAAGGQTLDMGGSGEHFSFSATAPSKVLDRKGYLYNATNTNLINADATGLLPNGDLIEYSLFMRVNLTGAGNNWLFQRGVSGGLTNSSIFVISPSITYSGGSGTADFAYNTGSSLLGKVITIGLTYRKGLQRLFYMGDHVATKNASNTYNISDTRMSVGSQTSGATSTGGEINEFILFGNELSLSDMMALHDMSLKLYSDI